MTRFFLKIRPEAAQFPHRTPCCLRFCVKPPGRKLRYGNGIKLQHCKALPALAPYILREGIVHADEARATEHENGIPLRWREAVKKIGRASLLGEPSPRQVRAPLT
ncbi:MAG: hypothetical protein DMG05_08470 [Acidobacteria bacterium]|nr:MAG: hypothetical protein DMG05_08470 [Acidobacteriota bacterium]